VYFTNPTLDSESQVVPIHAATRRFVVALKYEDLTPEVRALMVEEIDMDVKSEKIYRSRYLTQSGQGNWPDLLRTAAQTGTDDTLAAAVKGMFNKQVSKKKKGGFGTIMADVPYNANEVLAESEFNKYYCRGLSQFAVKESIPRLEVYRAKQVAQPRASSEEKIGLLVDPATILIDLRASQTEGVETALGIPPGPGSGITIRIPKK
jgi:hypothetical protein